METTHEKLGVYPSFPEEPTYETAPSPPALFEYTWYVILAYATLGQAWGVVIPSVGGAALGLLAAACFLSVGAQISRVYAPVALALCTGVSVIAVQYFFFSAQDFNNSIAFVPWLFTLIIVQALSLRPGFLHRFGLVAFVIGLGVVPYLQAHDDGGLMRVRASHTGISNPNALGMWFGFCAVFFLFWGMQSRTLALRAVYWAGGLGSLLMVGLTVSRGPLLGLVLACIVGLRSVLKRHFAPVFSLVVLMWLVYISGVFQETIDAYFGRGSVESGREKLWPLALERLLNSLWTGVGLEDLPIPIRVGQAMTPHNGLLYIGLAAGIIPLICFLGYLARAVSGSFRILRSVPAGEATLVAPLVTFALIEVMVLDTAFMSAWVVVALALAIAKRTPLPEN